MRRSIVCALVLIAGASIPGCGGDTVATPVPDPVKSPIKEPVASAIGADRNAFVPTTDPYGETVTRVAYLDQNWSAAESNQFYFTAQGSQIIPYDWAIALEQVDSNTPFFDPQNVLKYRYLPQKPGPLNPDGLPVGFVSDQGVGRAWLGMTCAACHTTEIHLGGVAYRVDGAPTQGDIQGLLSALIASLQQTKDDPAKFARFAPKILSGLDSPANRARLQAQMGITIKIRSGYNQRNFPGFDPKDTHPRPTHFGRLDAVDSIVNEVFRLAVKDPSPDAPLVGSEPATAPVSYPFLWDTPQHDVVEWLGIAKNGGALDVLSLSRNVGEVIGVFGDVAIPRDAPLFNTGYASSVKVLALESLENQLKGLWSPQWPAGFPKIDQAAATRGAVLYKQDFDNKGSCLDCHALIDRSDPNRKVVAVMGDSGTDPQASRNFFNRKGPSGRLEGVSANFAPFGTPIPAEAEANTLLTNVVTGTILGDWKGAPPDGLDQLAFKRKGVTSAVNIGTTGAKYKGRPLDGIWATAPYLHNGSVPNLDALMRPVAKRPNTFSVGTRAFDTVLVGFKTDVAGFPKFSTVDASGNEIDGNRNGGHEFGTGLSDAERHDLVEYLKTL